MLEVHHSICIYVQASNLFNTKILYFYYYFTVFRSVELSVRTHTQVHIFIEHIHTLWKIRFILFFRIFIYIYKIVSARDQHAAVYNAFRKPYKICYGYYHFMLCMYAKKRLTWKKKMRSILYIYYGTTRYMRWGVYKFYLLNRFVLSAQFINMYMYCICYAVQNKINGTRIKFYSHISELIDSTIYAWIFNVSYMYNKLLI